MKPLVAILPAAGLASRLNLPYPKEILRINKEKALIDISFDLFKDYDKRLVEFVVIINENKTAIVKYLAKYKSTFNISYTYQKPHEMEYTGAIKSAQHLFGDNNIVLLPDTVISLKKNTKLHQEVCEKLKKNGFTFLFKRENKHAILATKGSIKLDEDNRVLEYEDKPNENIGNYDGYWCAFAFKKKAFKNCITFMEQSTLNYNKRKISIRDTPIFNSDVIEVENYKDLGTWEEIENFLANNASVSG